MGHFDIKMAHYPDYTITMFGFDFRQEQVCRVLRQHRSTQRRAPTGREEEVGQMGFNRRRFGLCMALQLAC